MRPRVQISRTSVWLGFHPLDYGYETVISAPQSVGFGVWIEW